MSQTATSKLRGFVAAFTALVLTLALVPTTAFAALVEFDDNSVSSKVSGDTTGTITINGIDQDDVTITVYRIASILLDDTTNESKWVAVDDDGNGATYPDYTTTLAGHIDAWIDVYDVSEGETVSSADAADAAAAIASWVSSNPSNAGPVTLSSSDIEDVTTGQDVTGVTLSNLAPGIYYIAITDDAGTEYQPIITSIEMVAEVSDGAHTGKWVIESPEAITVKLPAGDTIDKDVLYDDATGGTYKAGDTITFVVEFSLSSSLDEFYFWDTMTNLTFSGTIAFYSSEPEVNNAGNGVSNTSAQVTTVNTNSDSAYYSLYTSTNANTHSFSGHSIGSGETFHVDLTAAGIEALYEASISAGNGGTIWVVYSATVSEATFDSLTNTFDTSVAYDSSDPNTGVTVDLETGIQVYKYDSSSESSALAGAQFAIYEATVTPQYDGQTLIGYQVTIVDADDNGTAGDEGDRIGTTGTTDSTGYANTGNTLYRTAAAYVIEEITAPTGYNLSSDYTVLLIDNDGSFIVLTYDEDSRLYTQTTSGSEDTNGYTNVRIPNTVSDALTGDGSGINLPTTGGMGTILFTVVGVLVMAGAAYLIIRSRRQQQD